MANFNYPKVQAGAPLGSVTGAGYHNAIRDALKWVDSQRNKTGAGRAGKLADDPGTVWIQNVSGADVPMGGILGIDDTIPVTPSDNLTDFYTNHSLKGVEPTVADHLGKWAVCTQPIPNKSTGIPGIGAGGMVGVFAARVYVSAFSDKCCDVIGKKTVSSEDCYLGSGQSGAQILWWDASSSGDNGTIVWAIVRLGSSGSASATPASWFQLLTDNDSDVTYIAKANPGTANPSNGFLYDAHATEVDPDDPDWTVMLLDQTGQIPCWAGDWVQAEPFSLTLASPNEDYAVAVITSRASSQLTFWGVLESDLFPGLGASASLLIGGVWSGKTVYDFHLLSTTYLPKGTVIEATYFTNLRRFYATAAPCNGGVVLPS